MINLFSYNVLQKQIQSHSQDGSEYDLTGVTDGLTDLRLRAPALSQVCSGGETGTHYATKPSLN